MEGTETPITGNVASGVTADAINARIALSNRSNGRTSPLTGLGATFLRFGNQYGINPAVVTAILQRESQLGADGSILPTRCNNFGGNTWGSATGYPKCAAASGIAGREWNQYPSPEAGLEGIFKNLDGAGYRATGGRLEDIMNRYAPAFENDHTAMFLTFASVGSALGVVINRDTNIYTGARRMGLGVDSPSGYAGKIADWVTGGLELVFFRGMLVLIGVILVGVAIRRLV